MAQLQAKVWRRIYVLPAFSPLFPRFTPKEGGTCVNPKVWSLEQLPILDGNGRQ
jgi:hypothetical protein